MKYIVAIIGLLVICSGCIVSELVHKDCHRPPKAVIEVYDAEGKLVK